MKLPYKEGTWFSVPLAKAGYAVGLIARMRPSGKIVLGYFFGPRRLEMPGLAEVTLLSPKQAILVVRFGDLRLLNGQWPIIGIDPSWSRDKWPSPDFLRRDPLTKRAWRVHYSDNDPSVIVSEKPDSYERDDLTDDGLDGAKAVEIDLNNLIK